MRKLMTLFPLTVAAAPALASPASLHLGGALDPVSVSLAAGLGGVALWRAHRSQRRR